MKVSVIIPFYKGISFLEDCLQSLVEQTFKNIEVILVCDHVEEDIQTTLDPYQTALMIKVINLEDKTGVAAARNYGLSVASGEYIYFLDSDDYISNNALELLVTKAEETKADFIYGKKIWTWFKRSIFMANFNTEDPANEEEEEEEEGNSMDSAELNMENGGESEGSNSLNEDQLLNDDSVDDDDNDQNAVNDEAAKQRAAYHQLITKRKGVRNILYCIC